MWKSDKTSADRTVANETLRQSFFSFPEEEKAREEILGNAEAATATCNDALKEKEEAICRAEKLHAEAKANARTALQRIQTLLTDFDRKLGANPPDLFASFCRLQSDLYAQKESLSKSLLSLSEALSSLEISRRGEEKISFLLITLRLDCEPLQGLQSRDRALTERWRGEKERLLTYTAQTLPQFFIRAAEASDLDKEGRSFRKIAVATLCGELRYCTEQMQRD